MGGSRCRRLFGSRFTQVGEGLGEAVQRELGLLLLLLRVGY